jgi:hypothetical protein
MEGEKRTMRQLLLRTCVVLCIVGTPSLALAAVTSAQQQAVAAILGQFPDGGQGLADAIAKAIETDPSLADAVVAAALTATPAQQHAIGSGLAAAATFFADSDTAAARAAQQQLQAAMANAPRVTLTTFNLTGGTTGLLAILTGSGVELTTHNCVSPSQPGNRC